MIETSRISLLVADDHVFVTDLMAQYIADQGGFSVHVAENFKETIKACKRSGPFDVILLDYFMPDMEGLDGIEAVVRANQTGKVVLFSGIESQVVLNGALEAGVYGLIPKNKSASQIAEIILTISKGEIYLPAWYTTLKEEHTVSALSKREMDVLGHLRQGLTNEEISEVCGITIGTVKLHIKSACTKLGAKNRTQAAMFAAELKL